MSLAIPNGKAEFLHANIVYYVATDFPGKRPVPWPREEQIPWDEPSAAPVVPEKANRWVVKKSPRMPGHARECRPDLAAAVEIRFAGRGS